jgi:hypothetical protein
MRWLKGFPACLILGLIVLDGCNANVPPEPTVAVLVTGTPTFTPQPPTATSPRPTVTLPPTWTPLPTITQPPTVTLPPTMTPPPPTATPDTAAVLPTISGAADGTIDLLLTEAQINAALARHFDANPLPDYAIAPRVTLGEASLFLNMQIVPQGAPAGSAPQGATLRVEFNLPGGMLETFPTELIPLHTGITTRQVKMGEGLLLQTLQDMVGQALNNLPVFYASAAIQPGGVSLRLARAGG